MYRKSFSILALFALLLAGCELHEPVEAIPAPTAKTGDCPPEIRRFDLQYTQLSLGNYLVELVTGPFIVKECMCRITQFELYVSLNSAGGWNLGLAGGQQVPFTPSSVGTLDLLTINDLAPIFESIGDQGNGLLKAITNTTGPFPELNRAGGLCIIENYDGQGTTGYPVGSPATSPIIVLEPTPVPNTFTVKVFIPEEITDPV